MKYLKIPALILLCALLVSLLGCEKLDLSGGKDKDGDLPASEDASDPRTLTVKTTVTGRDTFRPDEGISPKTDAILARIAEVEKETGYTVSVEIVSEETLSTAFLRASRAGKKYADVIQTDATFLTRYYDEGYFLSLADAGLENSATGVLKKQNGTAYAFRADGWNQPLPTLSYTLFYNEKIFRDADCDLPFELYEGGAWNWANFEKLCADVTNAYPGEIYALAHPTEGETDLIWATLHAAGLIYFTDDGECVMDSDEGLKGFSRLTALLNSGVTYPLGSEAAVEHESTAKLAFINRRTAFLVGNSSLLFETGSGSIAENLGEDLRIIGFPAIRKGVSGGAFTPDDIFLGVTAAANKNLCKELLPKLFAPLEEGDATEELTENYFYSEEDADLYLSLLASADTDTSLAMNDKRSLMEEYFLQVARGRSAKEILNNFQTIFNS